MLISAGFVCPPAANRKSISDMRTRDSELAYKLNRGNPGVNALQLDAVDQLDDDCFTLF